VNADPPAPVGAKGMFFPSRLDLVALRALGIKARTKTCFEEAAAVRDADPAIWTRIFQQPLQTIHDGLTDRIFSAPDL